MATKKTTTKKIVLPKDDTELAFEEGYENREPAVLETLDLKTLHPKEKKELYELWLSIPSMLRLLPPAEMAKMGYDVEDPIFLKLVLIRTPREFAREFGMSNNTPYKWEKKDPDMRDRALELARKENVRRFQKEVDFSFTQKVLKHGDANRVKLWNQLYKGWSEKSEVINKNLNFNATDFVRAVEKRNAEIRKNQGK